MRYKGEKLDTIGQIFDKALQIAKYNPSEAPEFFDEYVHHIMECGRINKQDAIERARSNFGYFAGYYDTEVSNLMTRTYNAVHPIFG